MTGGAAEDDPLGLGLEGPDRAVVAEAARFAAEVVAPHAAAWERDRSALPRAVFTEWSARGLNGLQVTRRRGGGGGSYLAKIAMAETMARHCMASCFSLINAQGLVTRIEREGSEDQIARYLAPMMSGELVCAPSLSEPGAGSDFAAIATAATKVPGGWRLAGAKAWVTNGATADLIQTYAQTQPGSGAAGIASFIVDLHAEGVERRQPYELMGGHAIGAAEIRLHDVFVPDRDLFAPAGEGFKRALRLVTAARTHVAAMCCGILAASLERAVAYGGERQAFGRPILANEGLRWSLAEVATDLEALRLLTARAGRLIDRGEDAILEAAQAKLFAARASARGVAACMQAMGARGLRTDEPFGRHLACARIAAYVDGTDEMQLERIGAYLPRRYGPAATAR